MRKQFLLLLLLLLIGAWGCTSKDKTIHRETYLWKFYDSHSFEGDYQIETKFLITPTEGDVLEQSMTFAKKGDQYARTLVTDQVHIRSFNANHHMITIDEKTGEVKRTFLPKGEAPDADIRQVIIGRHHLLYQKPKVEQDGEITKEIYQDKTVQTIYGFRRESLEWIELPSEEGTIRILLLSIANKADETLFQTPGE